MFIRSTPIRQKLNRAATPKHAKHATLPGQIRGFLHDAKSNNAQRTPAPTVGLVAAEGAAASCPRADAGLPETSGEAAETASRSDTTPTSDWILRDASSKLSQVAIDALCAPLKASIINDRKRARHAFLLRAATAVSFVGLSAIQVTQAAIPLDPSYYQWRAAPRNVAATGATTSTHGEQRNPLAPAFQFRAHVRWQPVAHSVRPQFYPAQAHPLHPAFNRSRAES